MTQTTRHDAGSALLIVLLLTAAMAALGGSLLMLTSVERVGTGAYRSSTQALYAAEAFAEVVTADLESQPDWTPALNGLRQSSFLESQWPGVPAWRGTADVLRMTQDLQTATDAETPAGVSRAVWRLYASGTLAGLVGETTSGVTPFVAAWVGDDTSEQDNAPAVDGNGLVRIRVSAVIAHGLQRSLEIVLRRRASDDPSSPPVVSGGLARVLTWREVQ